MNKLAILLLTMTVLLPAARADDQPATPAAYRADYAGHYSPTVLAALAAAGDERQSRQWFEATFTVFFYTLDKDYLPILHQALGRLAALGAARPRDIQSVYSSLLAVRDFPAARAFAAAHPSIQFIALPDTVALAGPSAKPTEWAVDAATGTLRQLAYDMPMGPVVIAVFNPGCHFSRNAAAAILGDPALTRAILPRIKLIAPPDTNFNVEDIRRWNGTHPGLQVSLMHDTADWPELPELATPTFYFFFDRRPVGNLAGWPTEGNTAALLTLAARRP